MPHPHGHRAAVVAFQFAESVPDLYDAVGKPDSDLGRRLRAELAAGTRIDFAYSLAYGTHILAVLWLVGRLLAWGGNNLGARSVAVRERSRRRGPGAAAAAKESPVAPPRRTMSEAKSATEEESASSTSSVSAGARGKAGEGGGALFGLVHACLFVG